MGDYALAHINTAAPGVKLPPHLCKNPSVTLKLSRLFRGGMELTHEKVVADLLFSGDYFTCVLPLPAIWGLTSEKGENLIWPESAPKEMLEEILAAAPETSGKTPEEQAGNTRKLPSKGHLRRVK